MRIAIREQLALLVLFCCLICVAVLSVAVWITNTNFVTTVSSNQLTLAATLYAEQLGSNMFLVQSSIEGIASRVLIQSALTRYIQLGNNTAANWIRAQQDLQIGLGTGGAGQYLLQAQVYAPSTDGPGGAGPVVSTTSNSTVPVQLPSNYTNGTAVMLGDPTPQGYPSNLYPQLDLETHLDNGTNVTTGSYLGVPVNVAYPLLLGPWQVNRTLALASMTMPILNNTSRQETIGWLTVVFSSDLIYLVANGIVGLGSTGINLIIAPNTTNNRLPSNIDYNSDLVKFVLPPLDNGTRALNRHPEAANHTGQEYAFTYASFPILETVFAGSKDTQASGNSNLQTNNELGDTVSVGYARVSTGAADWALIVEESFDEVHQPITTLRNLLLACIFGTIGAILLVVFPLAHYLIRPIRALRDATRKTVDPYEFSTRSQSSGSNIASDSAGDHSSLDEEQQTLAKKEGFLMRMNPFHNDKRTTINPALRGHHKFRIPGKVAESKHVIYDELTDLTTTFNGMCDELMMQYARLEERVKERTAELELSKKAAEAANESKTLFIANISHELKTPLNGILGMCAVSMSEDDPSKIKKSLNIIYKSGDLLLNLLTDLLTFSKNQIGQHLTLDEKEFRLADISSQVLSIFDKQAKEGQISLNVLFEGPVASLDPTSETPVPAEYGPSGTGRVQDMWLWGDQHRILQVVINLVNNSLKFTPPGGSVTVRLQCLGEVEQVEEQVVDRKDSTLSRNSRLSGTSRGSGIKSGKSLRFRSRDSSSHKSSISSDGTSPQLQPTRTNRDAYTALEINAREPRVLSSPDHTNVAANPVPINARILLFNFEVKDTGPGIPQAQQAKIFEPFVQGDLGLNKKYGGTGLGLSICSQLASLMKGDMSLKSVEGEGSAFTMQIPLRFVKEQAESVVTSEGGSQRNSLNLGVSDAAIISAKLDEGLSTISPPSSPTRAIIDGASSKPRLVGLSQPFFAPAPSLDTDATQLEVVQRIKAEVASKGSKVRVLVAEDNKVNQEVVLRMLKLEDISDVTVAKDGQEAYELVKKSMEENHLFNLIFMDVQMPNLDGLQSTRLIRGIGYSAPIVALTAFAEESNVKDCLDSGMDYFLPKPIRRPALKQVLKRYCATIPESDEPESPPVDNKKSKSKRKSAQAPAPAPAPASDPAPSTQTSPSESDSTQTTSPLDFTAQTTPMDITRTLSNKIQYRKGDDDHDISPMSNTRGLRGTKFDSLGVLASVAGKIGFIVALLGKRHGLADYVENQKGVYLGPS